MVKIEKKNLNPLKLKHFIRKICAGTPRGLSDSVRDKLCDQVPGGARGGDRQGVPGGELRDGEEDRGPVPARHGLSENSVRGLRSRQLSLCARPAQVSQPDPGRHCGQSGGGL